MSVDQPEQLRTLVHRFLRTFGLLDQSRTPCGVPLPVSQAHALMELLDSPGLSQTLLSGRLGLSKSSVSRLVRRLAEGDQLRRDPDPEDGRVFRLRLTDKGRRAAKVIESASRERFGRLLGGVPPERRGQLLEALELLVSAVPRVEDPGGAGGTGDG